MVPKNLVCFQKPSVRSSSDPEKNVYFSGSTTRSEGLFSVPSDKRQHTEQGNHSLRNTKVSREIEISLGVINLS